MLSVPRISGCCGLIQIGTVTTWSTPPGCGQNQFASRPARASSDTRQPFVGAGRGAGAGQPGEKTAGAVGHEKQVGRHFVLIFLGDAERGWRVAFGDARLETWEIGDEPRFTAEMLDLHPPVLFDQRARLLQAAEQFLLGLGGDRDVHVVDGRSDGEHGQQRAAEENPVRQRGEDAHRRLIEKFSSTSPPDSGTVTRRDSSGSASFQTNTL